MTNTNTFPQPKRLTKALAIALTAGVMIPLANAPLVAAEDSYQNDSDRTTRRRRPGRAPEPVEPAPTPQPQPQAQPETQQQRPRSPEPRQRTTDRTFDERRAPNEVSPVPRPTVEDYPEAVPIPDRWRIVDSLGYEEHWWDPYNRNLLKADKPVHGDWFFNLGIISDTIVEVRDVVTPVGISTTEEPDSLDVFGSPEQTSVVQNLAVEMVYYKGDTVFRPPDYEFRFTPVFNINHTELDEVLGVNANPDDGTTRKDSFVGLQDAFIDVHLRNVSERYDFDSIRVGIQPFNADFRGFLFQDNQFGIRLFGNRDNNFFQYNLAWFRRLEKDTNSGLNDVTEGLRDDDVFIANVYWQDMPVLGFFSQATIAHNRNRESDGFFYDKNDFIARPASLGLEKPREYDVTYFGYNGDGHFDRLNLTTSFYYAFGEEASSVFVEQESDIRAWFWATEAGFDMDWMRFRFSALFASGDDDPYDDVSSGFDAIFENPIFAGADTSYWIRQPVPLVGGGRVALSGRNGVLNSLRSSKEQGQSNFINPGTQLLGVGADFDVLPELRLTANWNYVSFMETAVLEAARNQGDIDKGIGHDISISCIYRPLMTQNIILRASYAKLLTDDGYEDLYPNTDPDYLMLNALFAY